MGWIINNIVLRESKKKKIMGNRKEIQVEPAQSNLSRTKYKGTWAVSAVILWRSLFATFLGRDSVLPQASFQS